MSKNIAFLVCTKVIGGHEMQALEFAKDLSKLYKLTLFVDTDLVYGFFKKEKLSIEVLNSNLLLKGSILYQILNGLKLRKRLFNKIKCYDVVFVSAGALEAGIAAGIALYRIKPTILYLPFFYDRRPLWGFIFGSIYNCFLSFFFNLFDRVVTINKIQSYIIRSLTRTPVSILPNRIRDVIVNHNLVESRLVVISRLDHQKRIGELFDWIDFAENPFKVLLVIGDGPLNERLKFEAKKIKFISIEFKGWLNALEQDLLLTRNDVLLVNSKLEGEPLVIREANKRGMKVLARNISGVRGTTNPFFRFNSKIELQLLLKSIKSYQIEKFNNIKNLKTPSERFSALSKLIRYI